LQSVGKLDFVSKLFVSRCSIEIESFRLFHQKKGENTINTSIYVGYDYYSSSNTDPSSKIIVEIYVKNILTIVANCA